MSKPFDDMRDIYDVARINLPGLLWCCAAVADNSVRLAEDEESAKQWAAAADGRYIFTVGVPSDTVIYGVEQVPATFRLKQVRP